MKTEAKILNAVEILDVQEIVFGYPDPRVQVRNMYFLSVVCFRCCKHFPPFSPEPQHQFHSNLGQSIIGW